MARASLFVVESGLGVLWRQSGCCCVLVPCSRGSLWDVLGTEISQDARELCLREARHGGYTSLPCAPWKALGSFRHDRFWFASCCAAAMAARSSMMEEQ